MNKKHELENLWNLARHNLDNDPTNSVALRDAAAIYRLYSEETTENDEETILTNLLEYANKQQHTETRNAIYTFLDTYLTNEKE